MQKRSQLAGIGAMQGGAGNSAPPIAPPQVSPGAPQAQPAAQNVPLAAPAPPSPAAIPVVKNVLQRSKKTSANQVIHQLSFVLKKKGIDHVVNNRGIFVDGVPLFRKYNITTDDPGSVTGKYAPLVLPPQQGPESPMDMGGQPPSDGPGGMPMIAQVYTGMGELTGVIDPEDQEVDHIRQIVLQVMSAPVFTRAQKVAKLMDAYVPHLQTMGWDLVDIGGRGLVLKKAGTDKEWVLLPVGDVQEEYMSNPDGYIMDTPEFGPQIIRKGAESSIMEQTLAQYMKESAYKIVDPKGRKPVEGKGNHEIPPGPMDRDGDKPPTPQRWPGYDQEGAMSVGDHIVKDSPKDKPQPLEGMPERQDFVREHRQFVEKIAQIHGDTVEDAAAVIEKSAQFDFLKNIRPFLNSPTSKRALYDIFRVIYKAANGGRVPTSNEIIDYIIKKVDAEYIDDVVREVGQKADTLNLKVNHIRQSFIAWLYNSIEDVGDMLAFLGVTPDQIVEDADDGYGTIEPSGFTDDEINGFSGRN